MVPTDDLKNECCRDLIATGYAYPKLAMKEGDVEYLKSAIKALEEVLKFMEIDRNVIPEIITAHLNLMEAYIILVRVENKKENYENALKVMRDAFKVLQKSVSEGYLDHHESRSLLSILEGIHERLIDKMREAGYDL
ncbi:MAG: hypothetical protein ACTSRL_23020 [Candidatus Helarchaeota archaeon]